MMVETRKRLDVTVQGMCNDDLPIVCRIAAECYDNPPLEADLVRSLRNDKRVGYVARVPRQRASGYMLVEYTAKAIHVLDLAVRPADRRAGVGRALLRWLGQRLTATNRKRVVVEIRDANLGAHLFLKACGFRAVEVLHEYFVGCDDEHFDDGYLFQFPA